MDARSRPGLEKKRAPDRSPLRTQTAARMNGPFALKRNRTPRPGVFHSGRLRFALGVLASVLLAPLVGRAQLPSFTILDSEDHAGATYSVGEGSVAAGLGTSLAGGIDSNGDSIPDLLIGAPGGDVPGHAYLVLGRPRRPHLVPLSRSEGVVTIRGGSGQADRLGAAVAFAGDVDGDGLSDLLIGSPRSPGAPGGSAYLIFSRV